MVSLFLPPLRERREDIPLLADHFIRKNNLLRQKNLTGLTPEALALLLAYDFPGNIRELENAVEHAFVLCREGSITPHCLPEAMLESFGAPKHLWFRLRRQRRWKRGRFWKRLNATAATVWRPPGNSGCTRARFSGRSKVWAFCCPRRTGAPAKVVEMVAGMRLYLFW